MNKKRVPFVGFDRFIRREWLDRVLELALVEEPITSMEERIHEVITGREAARKTLSVLKRWWIYEYPQTRDLRRRALELALEMPHEEWLLLHWGMALVNFPLFHVTSQTTGRLLRLQGEFRRQDIIQRVLETHANVGTIPRAVARIIQSMNEWKVIKKVKGSYTVNIMCPVENDKALEWFIEVLIRAAGRDSWDLRDLVNASEAFPFNIPFHTVHVARQSKRLAVQYEGIGREIVTMRQ